MSELATQPERETPAAIELCRGATRLLGSLGIAALAEVPLVTGRRLDLLGLDSKGCFVAVEIKSCRADFVSDGKWRDYLDWADRFFFAVGPTFPIEILPDQEGLIVADRFGGEIVRPPLERPIKPARRRAMTLRFARLAALRTANLLDPAARLDIP
jgi:hypothetical protein